MAYGMQVPIELELVMVKLRLLFWIQVILAAEVRERTRLSERDVDAVDLEHKGKS